MRAAAVTSASAVGVASLSALGGKNGWAESGYGLSQSGARLVSVVRISEAKEICKWSF
jgi:hypothetical protein